MKKRLITLKDSWPWALAAGLAVGGYIKAVLWSLSNTVNLEGLIVMGVVVAIVLGITVFRYVTRHFALSKWNDAYHTRTGVAVISKVGLVPYKKIDDACEEALLYWASWGAQNGKGVVLSKLYDALYGCTILVYPTLLERGKGTWWHGKFVGLQEDDTISVVYDKQIVINEDSLVNLVRHEVSHRCLTAIGVDPGPYGDSHHEIFSNTKYC